MASWQDDDDFSPESSGHQAVWDQLQQQDAQLQPRNSATSTPRSRQFNIHSASDEEEMDNIRLTPHQQYYHSYVDSGDSDGRRTRNPVVYDADSQTSKDHRFDATINCATHPLDYVRLNRRQLKAHNNRRFIYPPKTYTEMFNKKKQLSLGYRNFNRLSGFRDSCPSFLLHEATDKLVQSLQSPRQQPLKRSPYQCLVNGPTGMFSAEQSQLTISQKYAVLPPISAYTAHPPVYHLPAGDTQRVSVEITVRLPDTDVTGYSGQTSHTANDGAPYASMMTSSQCHGPPTKCPTLTRRSNVGHHAVMRARWH